MATRSDSIKHSRRQREIMDVIFTNGEATITEILRDVPNPPMRGAMRTLLAIMVRRGMISRKQSGREFIYRPAQPRGLAGQSAMKRVLDIFFGGSIEQALAAHFSDPRQSKALTPAERESIKRLIDRSRH